MHSPMNLLLLLAAWTAVAFAAPSGESTQSPARFCTVSENEQSKCLALKANATAHGLAPGVDCVRGIDKYDCMRLIDAGQADLIGCWALDAYVGGKNWNLRPLLRQKHTSDATIAYAALAVVRRDDTSIHTLDDLRGKRSCHTGVNRHVGWLYPMAQFVGRGLITSGDCVNNLPNMAAFFNSSCISNANSPAWDPEGQYSNMCAQCGGEGADFCSKNDPYASYTGAMKCLLDGRGDVAFVKDTTWDDMLTERPGAADRKSEFDLLCVDGTRKPFDGENSVKECNWGTVPEGVLMTSSSQTADERQAMVTMLQTMAQEPSSYSLFDSSAYADKHLLFRDGTKALEDVSDLTYQQYLDDYMRVRNNQFVCQVPALRWCTISTEETRKCQRMRDALLARFVKPDVECVEAADTSACMQKIQEGDADVITLDGGDIYKGGKERSLQVFMNEDLGKGSVKYSAVAVVRKNDTDISFTNLKGKKSCHTGLGRTAGWNIPAGALLNSGQVTLPEGDCNIPKAVGEFFSESCAPGALSSVYNPTGQNPASLCALCAGVGDDKCSRTEREPFYGYTGAFRCMATGSGDVAFVKHTTPGDNTDGHNEDDWARNLKSDDFELLCKDGTRQPISAYESCSLAKVPTHAVATQGAKTADEMRRYVFLLSVAQQYFGSKQGSNFHLFTSGSPSKDLLFSDSTASLDALPESKRNYRVYLDDIADVFDRLKAPGCTR